LAHLRASTLLCSLCTSLARGGRMWLRREEEEEGARWAAPAEGMAGILGSSPPPRGRRDGGSWGAPLLLELCRSCLLAPVARLHLLPVASTHVSSADLCPCLIEMSPARISSRRSPPTPAPADLSSRLLLGQRLRSAALLHNISGSFPLTINLPTFSCTIRGLV
jgi:hypothetical protein